MTPEKRETAIKWLTEEIRSLRLAPKINGCGPENWKDQLEIMETCLEAVRDYHSPDTTKMIPLTMEQLREMDGKPVWVEFEDGSGGLWGIVHISVFEQIVFANGLHCTIGHPYYGKTYKAYAYPPVHIDREAWEPCQKCKTCASCTDSIGDPNELPCSQCEQYSNYMPRNFCPNCGRPLTEEAWDELEKRLRGARA